MIHNIIQFFFISIGTRPYDTSIGPTESRITMYLSLGEGLSLKNIYYFIKEHRVSTNFC